ncbi:hypothetical protein NDU88_001139 [Pleurodeles waltl]|uniref:Uncharacterized protein n=1 Tax=Pleurodeles waltl TaxID=8319 RepID=A0AAV7P4I4_PLEWA|nr:hypothetical protein NDU88_001139 [Pleurodeles waltl]
MDVILSRLGTVEPSQLTLQKLAEENSSKITQKGSQFITLLLRVEDLEDRSGRNNLQVFCVLEGADADDARGFVVCLFREAFPALSVLDMDKASREACGDRRRIGVRPRGKRVGTEEE